MPGTSAHEHVGQFFDEPANVGPAAAAFLLGDAMPGTTLLIVAKPEHWRAIADELEWRGYPLESRMLDGRLHVLDSAHTLLRLLTDGAPDSARFDSVIGSFVRELANASPGGLRIFGDMVDVLADRGNLQDACMLEACWNRLAQNVPFSLCCGYSSVNLAGPGTVKMRRAICHAHTRMATDVLDPLGTFLVQSA
ncbi:MAG TPA: MEDS domain-containing protein [Vicinamibacterales bacterium]|nr:MEDS domain-containing protein [Vicinamibacterales bacterium]